MPIRDPRPEQTARTPRVLACVLCQQRKVKCDRRFPCANCGRAGAQCVPAGTLPSRPRRRRFPERELLQRLRHYEGLLRQNGVDFDPLHPAGSTATTDGHHASSPPLPLSLQAGGGQRGSRPAPPDRDDTESRGLPGERKAAADSTEATHAHVDIWHAINRVTRGSEGDDDDDREHDHDHHDHADNDGDYETDASLDIEARPGRAWDHKFQCNDHLLFGLPQPNVDLAASHPDQASIFRLWQIYLDNVNPLLKVTHIPTLQPRIIDAASNVATISPTLEALFFSIYCVAVASLANHECHALFRASRDDLLTRYQSACQKALLRCGAWRAGDMDSLTALYLYLISVRSQTDPRSLSCMLAVAVRIAQRMGMHMNSAYGGCTPFEAEMRRRLWWSLVVFDHRICELSDFKATMLTPIWDCDAPLNVNDFEIRPDMKHAPAPHQNPTEALLVVLRTEVADLIRHSTHHLTFVNPSLNLIAKSNPSANRTTTPTPTPTPTPTSTSTSTATATAATTAAATVTTATNATLATPATSAISATPPPPEEAGELDALTKTIEDKYLALCDEGDPLHYMAIWTTRGLIARSRLLDYYSRHSVSSAAKPTDAQRKRAACHALGMLECDTRLRTSPLVRGYSWFTDFNFPALAYCHFLNGLSRRPMEDYAEQAWASMNDNYEALVAHPNQCHGVAQGGTFFLSAVFSHIIMQAWEARQDAIRKQAARPEAPPLIVSDVKNRTVLLGSASCSLCPGCGARPGDDATSTHMTGDSGPAMPAMPMDMAGPHLGRGQCFASLQTATDPAVDQFWTEMDWGWLLSQGR